MTNYEKQSTIDALTMVLAEKILQYQQCMTKEEILQVRKVLRVEIRGIQNQLAVLREPEDDQQR